MSRSDPPRSSTAARSPRSDLADEPPDEDARRAPSPGRRFNLRFAAFVRWLHIYLSMFGLAAIVFFSLTGIPHQPQEGLDQPGIMLQKESLENVVGTQFRPVDRK